MNGESRKRRENRSKKQFLLILAAVIAVGAVLGLWQAGLFQADDNGFSPSNVTKMYLDVNPYSRSGESLPEVNAIVIHYVANPGSSAKNNRNYFNNLQNPANNPSGTSASAHFIVGLEGEVIQCIPVTEVAWANYPRNYDTVSIEVCHPDESGEFNAASRASLVTLTAELLQHFGLQPTDVIRHYDVSGKNCPKYYVENQDAWEALVQDIAAEMQ